MAGGSSTRRAPGALRRLRQPVYEEIEHTADLDLGGLLVNWLNEPLLFQETRHEVYREFEILSLSASTLRATVRGGPTESIRTMIKAATYHNLAILPLNGGYVATLVFDV